MMLSYRLRHWCALLASVVFSVGSTFGYVLSLPLPAYAQEISPVVQEEWELQKGDWIVANVETNLLQFVRGDNSAISSPYAIGSGINTGKKISYLGRYYDPKTPQQTWEIRSRHQQNWWNIFGSRESKEQLFLRLYEVKGEERIFTPYGIHTTPNIERIMDKLEGFGSWGCLLTRYDLLKQIEELYELNENVVKVITTGKDSLEVMREMDPASESGKTVFKS